MIDTLLREIRETSLLEWLGVSFGVAEVLLARANKVLLYPAGIISVVITSYLFYHIGLFAESALNIYYLVMSIYGWWWWVQKKNEKPVAITRSTASDWKTVTLIVTGGFMVIYFCLVKFTSSTVPLADAIVSATAWAGMWLLAKRKLENWILLNISNAIAVPLLFYKHVPLYGLLTIFLFIIAILGYRDWKKILNKDAHENPVIIS